MKIQKLYRLCSVMLLISACKQPVRLPATAAAVPQPEITISLLPYQNFDSTLIPFLKEEISNFYHCIVTVLPAAALPANAFYAPRQRYRADSLLRFQKPLTAAAVVVGLTDKDISTTHNNINDWGVFGLGYNPGKTCIISSHRLYKASASRQQFRERLLKVVLHELGHNLGLPHCTGPVTCLMNDARGTISQVDAEQKSLCINCSKLLRKD